MGMHVYRSTEAPSTAPTTDDIGMHWIKTTNPIGHWFAMHTSSVSGWVDLMGGQSLPLAGGTMTGDIILKYDGNINSSALQDKSAVCKKFVVDSIAALPSPAPAKYFGLTKFNASTYIGHASTPFGGSGYLETGDESKESLFSVGFGYFAGAVKQRHSSVAIGNYAGNTDQGLYGDASSSDLRIGGECVAIGYYAGSQSQAYRSIAIGSSAGGTHAGWTNNESNIAIGTSAGKRGQGYAPVDLAKVGHGIAIGTLSGGGEGAGSGQGGRAVAIGYKAGFDTQGEASIAIGMDCGTLSQAIDSIAIGRRSGESSQGTISGYSYNATNQFHAESAATAGYAAGGAISIGAETGRSAQAANTVAIGHLSAPGLTYENVAIGHKAVGGNPLGRASVAIGAKAVALLATNSNMSNNAGVTAVGYKSLYKTDLIGCSTSVGAYAGLEANGNGSVTVGYLAGIKAGEGSIFIGQGAGTLFASSSFTIPKPQKDNSKEIGGNFDPLQTSELHTIKGSSGRYATVVGYKAGGGAGWGSVVVGSEAGKMWNPNSSSIDVNCVIIGQKAAEIVTRTGSGLIAIGDGAFSSATALAHTGANTIAIGVSAAKFGGVNSGANNIAVGNNAMSTFGAVTGADNIAIGRTAMNQAVTTGTISGSFNIMIGVGTGAYKSFGGANNVAIGTGALKGATIDADTITNVVAIGNGCGVGSKVGADSIFIGRLAGSGTTTGTNVIAIGQSAGSKSGSGSISIGQNSGNNTATTGTVSIGNNSGLVAGQDTVTIGTDSGKLTTNANVVAIGKAAGSTTNLASGSIVIGTTAGAVTGTNAIAIGSTAGAGAGTNIVAIGTSAGLALGNDSIAIGNVAGKAADTHTNCVFLGSGATGSTGADQIQLGSATHTVYAQNAVQTRSDARDKTDIRDTVLGLDFILGLRPVDWRWDRRIDYREYIEKDGETTFVDHTPDGSKAGKRFHHGFIAQEVKSNCEEHGVDFGGYQDHKVNGGSDVLTLGYEEFIAPLVKSIQDQQAMINQQAMMIKDLQEAISKLLGK